MLPPRLPVLSALLLLLAAVVRCAAAPRLRGSGVRAGGSAEGPSLMEMVGRHQRMLAGPSGRGTKTGEARSHHGSEGHPRDPQHKAKFIMHLTGPLYFNPKCRKQFHRLYHSSRDCTDPTYYKRCARLLTQLARSPRCVER
ncbi:ALK and LTK ligand 2b [Cololabis saira]|uniref:ALK and LTK ligand 2b n=1 Tax=Cololabis saira TaxID=129043 RepID=UPI002AD228ED|nr:ALK and LTK ligand 2b [Cololabis saira]